MHTFKLYRLTKEIHVTSDRTIGEVKKIATASDSIYLQTNENELFFGTIQDENAVQLQRIRVGIVDVACGPDAVYVVNDTACVQCAPILSSAAEYAATDVRGDDSVDGSPWSDLPVIATQPTFQLTSQPNFTCDSRLWNSIGELVPIAKVFANADGVLMLSTLGDLYGMGQIPDVCVSKQPILLPFFVDYDIIQVAMGKHFVVVLTRNKQLSRRTNSKEGVEIDAISVSSACSIGCTTANASSEGDKMPGNWLEGHSSTVDGPHEIRTTSSMDNVSPKTAENDGDGETSSSDYVSLIVDVENEILKLLQAGNELIRTNVWCFGTVNKGHLGTGDHIRRKLIVQLTSLSEQGVQKVSCGDEHTAALTIDGRLYLWGDNAHEQISHWLEKEDFSSPKRYHKKTEQNILEVNCGQHSTFILTNSLERFELSRNKHFANIPLTNHRIDPLHAQFNGANSTSAAQNTLQFLAHGHYLLIGESNFVQLRFEHYMKYEQEYLQDILQKVAPFFPKFLHSMHRNVVKHPMLYKEFFNQYNRIISITAVNIQSMNIFSRTRSNGSKLCFVRHAMEYVTVYRTYVKCYCAILCSDDYKRMCETILPNTDFEAKFSTPLHHIGNYIEFAKELMAANETSTSIIRSAQTHWEQFKNKMDAMLTIAEQTVLFWKAHAKAFPPMLHIPERRFILDSKQLPLKLIPATRFSSQWFILFNDLFCVCSGSATVKQHALNTLWVCSVADKEVASAISLSPSFASGANGNRRYALEVITPEERFVVGAQSLEAKFKWLDEMERYVRLALGRNDVKSGKVPAYRVATYTFSDKHKSYAKCRYTGCWFAGQLHGNGNLEFPDGRVYIGQFSMGAISGFGRSIAPGISCYEGMFSNGKYHGYGTLEIQTQNGTYEGAFRNGQQNGHGVLINDHITYIGEFLNGAQNGFGVLDNSYTGEKYMGMFVDNKRCGHGFCITVEGQYFEGVFVDDELCGPGVAVFTDGSYFEGDLTMNGPTGRGTLYLPRESVKNENYIDLDERKMEMIGNLVSGTLGGTWTDIKIINGNLSLNQHFPKYSRTAGIVEIDNKWNSLFKDWEHDVFGKPADEIVDNKKIWHKVNSYMRTVKQNEWLRATISSSDGLIDRNADASSSSNRFDDRYLNGLLAPPRSSHADRNIPKSFSLSRITGANYKRNILAIERHKSISNEVLVNSTNYFAHDDMTLECNNNDRLSSLMAKSGSKTAAPCFGITKLDKEDMILVRDYLAKAFKSNHHPLGVLNAKISYCFYTSYGCWKVKPIAMLATQAMNEWENISKRIYDVVRRLFPTLPSDCGILDDELISHRSLLYPMLLSEGIYSTLFVLYANKCSQRDEVYRQRILICDKKTDQELIEFLRINSNYMPMIHNDEFQKAINCLKQVKEKYCPREMLKLIEMTFEHVENAAKIANTDLNISSLPAMPTTDIVPNAAVIDASHNDVSVASASANPAPTVLLNADTMMPLSIFLIIRAAIPHLGTEILLLEDLMGSDFEMLGFASYCFTTIKAGYQHIINDQFLHQ